MKEIKQRFELYNPSKGSSLELSTYQRLIHIVWGKKYPVTTIKKAFKIFVEKDDYEKSNKKEVLDFLLLANSI